MRLDARLRLSLYARMLVATGVVASFSTAVGLFVAALGGFLGFAGIGMLFRVFEAVASAPRLAPHAPVPAAAVAAAALAGLVTVYLVWPAVSRYTGVEYLVPSRHPVSLATLGFSLACIYLLVVEGAAAAMAVLSLALSSLWGFALVLVAAAAVAVVVTVAAVRREVRDLREQLVADSVPASETHPRLVSTVRRLARLADVRAPEVYVTASDRPESFTVGTGESATVVVSAGLVDALSDEELEAVLAHEVSHLANGDSRIMGAVLVPVLIAEGFVEESSSDPSDVIWNGAFTLVKLYGQFGVAILSRGREWGADAGVAALTGSPTDLASALATLDDARETPTTDLRDWERSVAAIDILPPSDRDVGTGPFRTHPSTADRIERLGELAARLEEQ